MDFVEDDQSQDVADAVYGLEQDHGLGVEGFGGFFEVPLDFSELVVVEIDAVEIQVYTFLHTGIGEAVAQ
jgi:hypothetical protein